MASRWIGDKSNSDWQGRSAQHTKPQIEPRYAVLCWLGRYLEPTSESRLRQTRTRSWMELIRPPRFAKADQRPKTGSSRDAEAAATRFPIAAVRECGNRRRGARC